MLRETRFYFIRKRDFRMPVRTYTKQMLMTKPLLEKKEILKNLCTQIRLQVQLAPLRLTDSGSLGKYSLCLTM